MSKRRRSSGGRRALEARFWGRPSADGPTGTDGAEPAAGPPATAPIRPTPEPGALVRSLGPPPLGVDGAVAERHLVAVYEEAVRAATALAAANGLLATTAEEDV